MINLERDIHSLSDFKRNTPEFLEQLAETGEPVVLTLNGRAKVIVQDAASYQRLMEQLERAETVAAVWDGIKAANEGRVMSLDEYDRRMRKKIRAAKSK
jgi:prevent-host-death family protein